MIILVVKKLKYRLLQMLRLMFALAILIILVMQLVNTIKSIQIEEEHFPGGEPVKVEQGVTAHQHQENSFLEKLLDKLGKYHRGDN
ncbi:MAG: hypothetical protein H0Z40_06670 [Desulfotomaculum sp.]|nr:hypothetical protein [Desulfotomaculum sp.]